MYIVHTLRRSLTPKTLFIKIFHQFIFRDVAYEMRARAMLHTVDDG